MAVLKVLGQIHLHYYAYGSYFVRSFAMVYLKEHGDICLLTTDMRCISTGLDPSSTLMVTQSCNKHNVNEKGSFASK